MKTSLGTQCENCVLCDGPHSTVPLSLHLENGGNHGTCLSC